MALLSTLFGAFYAVLLVVLVRGLWTPRNIFMNSIACAFILANCLGLALPESAMDVFNYSIENSWLVKAGIGYLPFIVSVVLLSLHNTRQLRIDGGLNLQPYANRFVAFVYTAILYVSSLPVIIYLYSSGRERLFSIASISDRETAYTTRYSFQADTESFALVSSFVAFGVIPVLGSVAIALTPDAQRRKISVLLSPVFILAALRMLCNLQRANVIVGGITLFTIAYFTFVGDVFNKRQLLRLLRPALLAGLFVFSILVIAVYKYTDPYRSPIYSGLERIFIMPSHTASIYFHVFPEVIPFRGGKKAHSMSSDAVSPSNDVSYWDMGQLASTARHCANANFVAVAYSGFGFSAVLIFSILMSAGLFIYSRFAASMGYYFSIMSVCGAIYGIFVVVQTDLNSAVYHGFGILQIFVFGLLMLYPSVRRRFFR